MVIGKILAIDDDIDMRRLYYTILKKRGFDVHLAKDGMEGLIKIKKLLPDLVILDIMMPNKGGLKLLKDLEKGGRLRKTIPIVIISGAVKETGVSIKRYIRSSDDPGKQPFKIVQFVNKPITPKVLLETVNKNI